MTILGYVQRGGIPCAADRLLASRLGTAAAHAVSKGQFGVMVAARGEDTELVPLEEVAGKLKLVPARPRVDRRPPASSAPGSATDHASGAFAQVDVFGDGAASPGNPLAVVHDAGGLDDAAMQDVRRLDEPVRDHVPASRRPIRRPTTASGSSPPSASCRSPATRRSAARTPGWRPAGVPHRRARSCRSAGSGIVHVRLDGDRPAFAAPPRRPHRAARRGAPRDRRGRPRHPRAPSGSPTSGATTGRRG